MGQRIAAICLFILILATGLVVYDDYGISYDEGFEHTHSLINYRYLNEVLLGRSIPQLADYPWLPEYHERYYNVAAQVPLVFYEDLHDFGLSSRAVFLARHLYTFLIYFVALICFYLLCRALFSNGWLALALTAALWLYPRFFAESFYNNKDIVFVSFYIISLYALVQVLRSGRRLGWCLFFALASAFMINARIMGVMLLLALVGFMLLEDILPLFGAASGSRPNASGRPQLLRQVLPYALVTVGTGLIYLLITPASWQNPWQYVVDSLVTFAHYRWMGHNLFAGRLIGIGELPWYYIPAWIGITVPLVYLVLFCTGVGFLLGGVIKRGRRALWEERTLWLMLALLVLPLAGFILMNTWIYNGWRHVYFLFIPLLIIAGHGLEHLSRLRFRHGRLPQVFAVLLLVISLAWQAGWIITHHPHQYVYFNAVGRPIADQFDRDYWRLTQTELYRWILEDAQQEPVTVYDYYLNHPQLLEPDEQARLVLVDGQPLEKLDPPPDYILESYYNVAGNTVSHPGYSEVYAIWVDGFKIASVFKRN